jgi:hypothetical protein
MANNLKHEDWTFIRSQRRECIVCGDITVGAFSRPVPGATIVDLISCCPKCRDNGAIIEHLDGDTSADLNVIHEVAKEINATEDAQAARFLALLPPRI